MKKNFLLSMLIMVFLVSCGQGLDEQSSTEIDEEIKTEQQDETSSDKEKENATETEDNSDDTTSDNQSTSTDTTNKNKSGPLSELKVHYIDVGQADATLLQFENYTILYDTGDWRGNQVVTYLQSQNIASLDLVIVSHPDADHIGQLEDVMGSFEVGEVWMTGNESTSQTFQSAVAAVLNSGADYHEPRTGETFEMGSMEIKVIYPNSTTGKSNEESLSVLFTYGEVSFLFTGDADKNAEKNMMDTGINLDADVLQLGHHGSKTSSDPAFIKKVSPSVAIYSAGADNSYGHPHAEVVTPIQNAGIKLYGTDVHGTIIVESDGKEYSILTKKDDTISPKSNKSTSESSPSETKKKEDTNANNNTNAGSCVNINTASFEEVQQIKHIGPARAEELIAKRPYSSVDGLNAIKGIGPSRIQDIKDEGIACVQ